MINSVLHGDCLELMKDIPDSSIDMILCDLPYGTTACKWDTVIPFDPLWAQYKRIVKPNAAIVLTASQPFTSQLVMSNPEWFRYEWIWVKSKITGVLNAKKMPVRKHEQILVFAEKMPNYNPQGLTRKPAITRQGGCSNNYGKRSTVAYLQEFTGYPSDVVHFSSPGNTTHPTQKPVALFEYLIKTYTNEGDVVLDNCAGSGTTAVAAINTNRNYILMEKEPKYIDIINQRLGNHEPMPELTFPPQNQQLSLFA